MPAFLIGLFPNVQNPFELVHFLRAVGIGGFIDSRKMDHALEICPGKDAYGWGMVETLERRSTQVVGLLWRGTTGID